VGDPHPSVLGLGSGECNTIDMIWAAVRPDLLGYMVPDHSATAWYVLRQWLRWQPSGPDARIRRAGRVMGDDARRAIGVPCTCNNVPPYFDPSDTVRLCEREPDAKAESTAEEARLPGIGSHRFRAPAPSRRYLTVVCFTTACFISGQGRCESLVFLAFSMQEHQ